MVGERNSKFLIIYCTIAGFISAWGISGLLVLVDLASGTPPGTFFAVIGISMEIDNPAIAQYVGFGLHVLTGTISGNIFGQISIFVSRLTPTGYANGIIAGRMAELNLFTKERRNKASLN
jgi:hypothetical protein